MTAKSQVHPLVKDHADLIAAHDQITGSDQSSIAKRAGKVRQINLVELNLTLGGVKFDHWTSPAKQPRKSGGFTDDELVDRIGRLRVVVTDESIHPTIRATADAELARQVKIAQERGLIASAAA
jgi:hypothetical protein